MKRLLVLFTSGFPYGISEPFLELEYPLYKDYFDKVLIVTPSAKGDKPTRAVDNSFVKVLQDHTVNKDVASVLGALPWMLTDRMFYKEVFDLLFRKKFMFCRLYELFAASLCANHCAKQAYKFIKKNAEYDEVILYGVWMFVPAYAAVRLNNKCKNKYLTVSRAHSFDLYLERTKTGYRPFHEQLYNDLDKIAVISEYGKKYLEDLYGDSDKLSVHKLGALDRKGENPHSDRSELKIVSCARTVPLKRLDRIVDALSKIKDRRVHWTHLGSGEAQEALEEYAKEKLPSNITAVFSGTIPNTEVYEIYNTKPFHIFVIVSETEGVPVAVMEAMSFGIPVIATAVGGTPELIDEGKNGFLLDKDYSDEELIEKLSKMADMSECEYHTMRNSAKEKFQKEYDAQLNSRKFIEFCISEQKNKQIIPNIGDRT